MLRGATNDPAYDAITAVTVQSYKVVSTAGSEDSGLPGWAVAIIVIGAVAVAVAAGVVAWKYVYHA